MLVRLWVLQHGSEERSSVFLGFFSLGRQHLSANAAASRKPSLKRSNKLGGVTGPRFHPHSLSPLWTVFIWTPPPSRICLFPFLSTPPFFSPSIFPSTLPPALYDCHQHPLSPPTAFSSSSASLLSHWHHTLLPSPENHFKQPAPSKPTVSQPGSQFSQPASPSAST